MFKKQKEEPQKEVIEEQEDNDVEIELNEENIEEVMSYGGISRDEAIKLLKKYKGDAIEAISNLN